MRVGFSDSGQTLYLVQGRANPVLHGPNSIESNLFHHGETNIQGWMNVGESYSCDLEQRTLLPRSPIYELEKQEGGVIQRLKMFGAATAAAELLQSHL